MVSSKKVLFDNFGRATPGQLVWVYLNHELDREENVHPECRPELDKKLCEVCHKPIVKIDTSKFSDEIRQMIYIPGDDISYEELTDLEADAATADVAAFLRSEGITVKSVE
jgi:hypothetical protein